MVVILLAMLVGTQAANAPTDPAPKPKLICRESEHETGSHIHGGTRCMTAEKWQAEDQVRQSRSPSMRVTEGQGDALTKHVPPQ